jgi:hypothetical protein
MIFNPLMKGEPLLEARESKDSKGTHVMVQNFYSCSAKGLKRFQIAAHCKRRCDVLGMMVASQFQ